MKIKIFRSIGLILISGVFFALFGTGAIAGDGASQKDRSPTLAQKEIDASELRLSVWEWKSGGELTLFANGQARHTEWLQNGSWQTLSGGTLLLTHPDGLNFFVTFSDEKNARIFCAKGGRTTITLKD